MNDQAYTLRDLEMIAMNSTPTRIAFSIPFATTHEKRTLLVEEALDWIAQEFTKTRQHRFERDEDELTADVILSLKSMGFQASHDTQYGGHADIVIEMRDDFLWIGESKVHGSYDHLLQGFKQLTTRYTTGLSGQDTGGMIIFCKNKDAGSVMDEWMVRLKSDITSIEIEDAESRSFKRRSTHAHQVSGRPFRVNHLLMSVHFDPKDRK